MDENQLWKAKRNWSFRINNLEVGSCDERLSYLNKQNKAEISCWSESNESRWVISVLDPNSDGIDIRFVGDRPLKKPVKWNEFKMICKIGLKLLKGHLESNK